MEFVAPTFVIKAVVTLISAYVLDLSAYVQ